MPTPQDVNLENVPEFIQKQAQAAIDLTTPKETTEEKVETPPEPKAEEPPPEKEPEFKALATEEMTKEQRYKVLEGMQRAEARRRMQEKAAYEAEIAALKAQSPPAQQLPAQQLNPETLQQLQEAFGEKNLNFLDEYLASRGYVKSDDLKTVKDEIDRVHSTAQTTAQQGFHKEMDDLTEGKWQEINKQQWFIDAMNEEEGNTGMTRLEFAKKHLAERNAPKLAWYFTNLHPPTQDKAPKIDKKKLTTPPATASAARSVDEDQEIPIVKTSEMEKFSRDVITGKYNGREEEMRKFEAKMRAAANAGRIVQG